MRVIRGLELEADTFKNLNDPQQFFLCLLCKIKKE